MLTQSDWEPILRLALEETNKAIDRLVDKFAPKLQSWLDQLLNNPIPEDWRDELAAFVQRTADDDNLAIAPHSIATLEQLIESRIAGTGRFVKFGPARRGSAAAASPSPAVVSTVAEVNGPPAHGAPQAAQSRTSGESAPLSGEQLRIRAAQLARAFQNKLGLTDDERESLQQYYERVLSTGVAEPLPEFLQDKLAEQERKIAAQNGQPALRGVGEPSGPPSGQAPRLPDILAPGVLPSEVAEKAAQADLAKSVENAAGKSFGVMGVRPERKDGRRNPRYWEEGPLDEDGDRPWVLRSSLSDQEILDAFADTQSKDAGAACTNEMLCKRAASIVVINGFIDFFNKQPAKVKERGLRWIVAMLRNAGGNIEDAMEHFTETIEDKRGIDPKNIRAGDQVHFINPAPHGVTRGDGGKNVIAHGPDSFSAPYAGGPRQSYEEIQIEIRSWTELPKKPPELDKIIVDRIRRPVLPRWYTDR
jgi:hypothetical protein